MRFVTYVYEDELETVPHPYGPAKLHTMILPESSISDGTVVTEPDYQPPSRHQEDNSQLLGDGWLDFDGIVI